MEDIKLLQYIFSKWNSNNIEYCVLRKYEEVYKNIDNDVDILVESSNYERAVSMIYDVAKGNGWKVHINIPKDNLNGIHMHKYINGKICLLHIDVFKNVAWKGKVVLNSDTVLKDRIKYKDLFIPEKCMQSVLEIIGRLMYHGYIKDEYKEKLLENLNNNEDKMKKIFEGIFQEKVAKQLIEHIKKHNWEKIKKQKKLYRRSFVKNKIIHSPIKLIFEELRYYKYLICKVLKPTGVFIALLGPDGSGKSTISSELCNKLKKAFNKDSFRVFHWRPGVLPQINNIFKKKSDIKNEVVTEPHKLNPYNRGVSFIRFIYYWLDFILGYFFVILPTKIKGGVVIFDRYYFDYYIDKRRYRLKISDTTVRIFGKFIAKPDLVFYLRGDAKTLYNRKKELTIEETDRQLKILDLLIKKVKNGEVVDCTRSVEDISKEISLRILKEV